MPSEIAGRATQGGTSTPPGGGVTELDDVAVAVDGSLVAAADGTGDGGYEGPRNGLEAPLLSGWRRRSEQPSLAESFATVRWHSSSSNGCMALLQKAGAFLGVGFLVAVG